MRPRHTPHTLPAFPVHAAAFLAPDRLVLGGGGGFSKTGVQNKIVCIHSFQLPVILTSPHSVYIL